MLALILRLGLILSVAVFIPSVAHATFGCEIAATKGGFANLFEKPDQISKIIRRIPNGAMVSLLDAEMFQKHKKIAAEKRWYLVTHSATGDRRWGHGRRGWVLRKDIKPDSCG